MGDGFKFAIGQTVRLAKSSEEGEVIGRAEYAAGERQYYLRYCAGDGRQCESWWGESAIA
jgi:hypothetical protein